MKKIPYLSVYLQIMPRLTLIIDNFFQCKWDWNMTMNGIRRDGSINAHRPRQGRPRPPICAGHTGRMRNVLIRVSLYGYLVSIRYYSI